MQTDDREATTAMDPSSRAADAPRGDAPARAAAGLGVVVVLALGVLVWGRVAATEMVAMVLTGLWFLAVLGGAVAVAQRNRRLAVPLAVGYGLSAVAAAVLLGLPQLRDRTVDEQVATVDSASAVGADAAGAEAADAPADAPDAPEREDAATGDDAAAGADTAADDGTGDGAAAVEGPQPDDEAPAGNTALAAGSFVDLAHPGRGDATVVDLADGGRVLTLTDFETDGGPDLRVYLTARDPSVDGEIGEFVDLGALKGNVGNQQYEIPDDVDIDALRNAVVWCRAFSVGFTSAALAAP